MATTAPTPDEILAAWQSRPLGTATISTSILADQARSTYSVVVIAVVGDTLTYTRDGVWYSRARRDARTEWTLDPAPRPAVTAGPAPRRRVRLRMRWGYLAASVGVAAVIAGVAIGAIDAMPAPAATVTPAPGGIGLCASAYSNDCAVETGDTEPLILPEPVESIVPAPPVEPEPIEPEPITAEPAVAKPAPEPARYCEDDTDTGCIDPPAEVGVTVTYPSADAAADLIGAGVACYGVADAAGPWACWLPGATDAAPQG